MINMLKCSVDVGFKCGKILKVMLSNANFILQNLINKMQKKIAFLIRYYFIKGYNLAML